MFFVLHWIHGNLIPLGWDAIDTIVHGHLTKVNVLSKVSKEKVVVLRLKYKPWSRYKFAKRPCTITLGSSDFVVPEQMFAALILEDFRHHSNIAEENQHRGSAQYLGAIYCPWSGYISPSLSYWAGGNCCGFMQVCCPVKWSRFICSWVNILLTQSKL